MAGQSAPFRVIKFWTEYKRVAGGLKPIDKVEYCAVGMANKATTVARVDDLKRVRDNIDPDDVAGNIAKMRWDYIAPIYAAWKEGHETPEHGTPIAAWPGLTPEQAEVFRTMGLRSVEDIANASDGIMGRINLPGVRDIQANAKRFLEAQDGQRVADQLAEKDKQISLLSDQLEELRQIVIAQQSRDDDDDDRPRRRGRPPKVVTDEVSPE
jgi:hypothetical protein